MNKYVYLYMYRNVLMKSQDGLRLTESLWGRLLVEYSFH